MVNGLELRRSLLLLVILWMIRTNPISKTMSIFVCCLFYWEAQKSTQCNHWTLSQMNILFLSYLAFPNYLSRHSSCSGLWPRCCFYMCSFLDLSSFMTFQELPLWDSFSDFSRKNKSATPPICSYSTSFMLCSNRWPLNGKAFFPGPGDSKL